MQSELVRQQMVRERLLATLSGFFAAVTLLLAGIGLVRCPQRRRDPVPA